MFVYRPKSFFKLVLVGFALVALPLIIAFVSATIYVNQLAEQSQQAVSHAVQVTQGSRMLVEQLIAMERNARQYQVLGDQSLFQLYAATHQKYQQTTARMSQLPLDDYQKHQLKILIKKEHDIFRILQHNPYDSVASSKAILEFASLTELAKSLLAKSNILIDRETKRTQDMALRARRVLMWQALASLPGTAIFAVVFVLLISRPIKQIDQAIRRLGDGDFSSSTSVTGPQDLEYLGKRLDWLRLRLIELEEEKRKFLRHVSHELKTPLTAIREGAELLSEEVVGSLNDQQREITYILQQKSKHLQNLIEDLLNFSMAQERNAAFEIKPVQLNRLIEEVAIDHKPIIMSKKIDLEIYSSEVFVLGDDEKLRIIIDNLLSNAVKYSPDGGKIRISLRRESENAVLDIIDSGPGIDKKEKNRIFDPFYQGSREPDGPVKGSGIGLSITREYLIAHHGNIEIIDDISQGTHFRVTLPVKSKDAA
jgi:two-component system sensor histidine kinase GlrK